MVSGYPVNMDGTFGTRIHRTEKFIERFSEKYPDAVIERWDERLTTKSADRAMIDMGVSQRRKGISDMIAAQLILQSYLDSKRA
ncbi:MAG: Holliday junction resolvase RuvX [Clostridia bacterium]|nr:Holliday junction resolvase RuvX [Clostridia bacterium]